ncbi:LacI family DNA-binding transcriptional regulator [Tabrizicola sp.]|uniref:LacI family DNA-binding transcriptional regulator n=1 Tax=Tabrizicola sp. TaxID=2005166 RepID=UPI002736D28D|nr:LacI family DNA-binding transcriptional regulator [Tabrizicola sp.]MDP3197313.1 LacI family DNA-binding transcriptional regulator [Tabrizicola sp.]
MADGDTETRVTIRTVAADAGVSVAAVSKVMRNAYGVSDALRLKVEASIERLGYRPSVAARGMRGRTFTLGVLLVGIDNPFLPGIYQGIESVTESAGYKIMVGVGAARARTEVSLIEQMIDNRMDGLILVASQIAGETLEHFARQIPIVVVGHHEPAAQGYDTINNDDQMGARLAVQALIDRGYQDIAYLTQTDQDDHLADVAPQREIGYRTAILAANLAPRILALPQHGAPRDHQIHQMLTAPDRPRAIFCWSDLDAIPLLSEALRLGLRVPEDLALIGYDNSPMAGLAMINLTSVDQDGPRLGKLAAEAVFTRMNGRRVAEHILIEPTLIPRGSF